MKNTAAGLVFGAALLAPISDATAKELAGLSMDVSDSKKSALVEGNTSSSISNAFLYEEGTALEGGNPDTCLLLKKLNISGMTNEEIVAINMAWERQPVWAHDYVLNFFANNMGNFKGVEKERMFCLMNEIYLELEGKQLLYADGKRLAMEALRKLNTEQRKNVSQSREQFIEGWVANAESVSAESRTQSAELKAQSAELKAQSAELKAQSAELRVQGIQVFVSLYENYKENPSKEGLNRLRTSVVDMQGGQRDLSSVKHILEYIEKEKQRHPDWIQ